jgi:hypothetical protein
MRLRFAGTSIFMAMLMVLGSSAYAFATRAVPIEILLNGVVLLKGSDSDNGSRDFDQVWNDLHKVRFAITEEFTKKYVRPDSTEVVLECTDKGADEPDLVIDESYGGEARVRTLKLHRVKPDRFNQEWTLDKEQLTQLFYAREIPRYRAAELAKPRGDRVVKPSDGQKRSVAITVVANDIVLLEGSDDDDGRRDADAIWDDLSNVRLKASEAFQKEYGKTDFQLVTFKCTVNVTHAGKCRDVEFRLRRVMPDELGREWMLSADDVKNKFEWRDISRELATQLKNPERSRFRR